MNQHPLPRPTTIIALMPNILLLYQPYLGPRLIIVNTSHKTLRGPLRMTIARDWDLNQMGKYIACGLQYQSTINKRHQNVLSKRLLSPKTYHPHFQHPMPARENLPRHQRRVRLSTLTNPYHPRQRLQDHKRYLLLIRGCPLISMCGRIRPRIKLIRQTRIHPYRLSLGSPLSRDSILSC